MDSQPSSDRARPVLFRYEGERISGEKFRLDIWHQPLAKANEVVRSVEVTVFGHHNTRRYSPKYFADMLPVEREMLLEGLPPELRPLMHGWMTFALQEN